MHHQLIIDTAGSRPFVAIARNGQSLGSWWGHAGQYHSQNLLLGIDECLRPHKVEARNLHSIAIGVGPGMFTGLRIGITTAVFLADLANIPLVPFSCLQAIAVSADKLCSEDSTNIWALGDARSQRVYALKYDRSLPLTDKTHGAEEAHFPAELALQMKAGDWICGEGATLYQSVWPKHVRSRLQDPYLDAETISQMAFRFFTEGKIKSPLNISPKYLKTGQVHLP